MQQILPQLDAIEAQLGGDPPLSPAEKRHAIRMRKGGMPIVTAIGNIVRSTSQLASSGLVDLDTMQQGLDRATALQPLVQRLAALDNHVLDVVFASQSTSWGIAVHAYGLLKRLARTNRDLATALQPVTEFFARKPKSPAPPGTPNKRARKATTKAVKQLQRHAPQLLAGATPPATPAPAPIAAPAVTPAAPTAVTPPANGAPHS